MEEVQVQAQEPGFRFYPTEEELISFYLHNKLADTNREIDRVIPLVNIYQLEPWHLPSYSGELCHGDTEQWFFFVSRREREVRGARANRSTATGYWKATGSPSYVYSSGNRVIGVKKSMVFYKGKAPTGRKTKWKMNEYTAIQEEFSTSIPKLRNELSLCRVYVVSGTFRAFDRRPMAPASVDNQDISRLFNFTSDSSTQNPVSNDTITPDDDHSICNNNSSVVAADSKWENMLELEEIINLS